MPVEIRGLSYDYDQKTKFQKRALFDIGFTVRDGDFLGIVGHTGSGKSTLVTHFNALNRVQQGTVVVDGVDLSQKFDYKALRAKVGMVFQYPEYQLFDETVYKDVAFGPKNLGLDEREIAVRVEAAIRMVGLDYDAVKERSPFELSGGQMRRAAIAGVLAMRPEILILDEPTAGLDPRGKREVMRLIQGFRAMCKIIVMISHNMDEVAANCSRIIVMNEGRVYGDYAPEELFHNEELLSALRIDMPAVCTLTRRLNERGFSLPEDTLDEAVLLERLVGAVRAKRGGGHA
ncbi:MAG: energy-coupling factor transporter ATPase [Clostridiales bacterium]|jgi:energy-coupling factor transport system ATP-binding protein|nr:energy-coupling factor transporter ATPase [Clostridiales bacterium]